MEGLWKSEIAPDVGVSLIPVCHVTSDSDNLATPFWADIAYGFSMLNQEQLDRLSEMKKKHYS